jgi:hypothetical protein
MRAVDVIPPLQLTQPAILSLFEQLLSSSEGRGGGSVDRIASLMAQKKDFVSGQGPPFDVRQSLKSLFGHPPLVLCLNEQAGRVSITSFDPLTRSDDNDHPLTIPFSYREAGDNLAFDKENTQ